MVSMVASNLVACRIIIKFIQLIGSTYKYYEAKKILEGHRGVA
jgi:hypothetical protein